MTALETLPAPRTEWLGVDAYEVDVDGITAVEAYRGTRLGTYAQHRFMADQKVDCPDADVLIAEWGFVGIATLKTYPDDAWGEVDRLFGVWVGPDHESWTTYELAESASAEADQ